MWDVLKFFPDTENKIKPDPYVRKHLSEIFTGMQGRWTRLKIIEQLATRPQNAHQLKKRLRMDYKSIQRNLKILEKNNLVLKVGSNYGTMYFLTEYLQEHVYSFDAVIKKVEEKLSKKKVYIE